MEEFSLDDPTQLLEAASDFAFYPGFQNDAAVKSFHDVIIRGNLGLGNQEFRSLNSLKEIMGATPYCVTEDMNGILSEEEESLFTVNYWLDKHVALGQINYCSVLTAMRDAYISIKEMEGANSDNIISFLKDQDSDAKRFLFHLAFCIIQLKDVSFRLHEVAVPLFRKQYQLLMKENQLIRMAKMKVSSSCLGHSDEPSPSASDDTLKPMRKELDMVDRKCLNCSLKSIEEKSLTTQASILASIEKSFLLVVKEFLELEGKQQVDESNNLAVNIYSILLILTEMLINLGMAIYLEVSEGCKKLKTTHVADKMEANTPAENLCFECNKSLDPYVDTVDLKAVDNLASSYEGRLTNFRELMENHFKSFQSKIKTGFVDRDFIDNKSTELMRQVEAGVNQLRIEMVQKVDDLTELLNRAYNSFPPDSNEYRIALDCHQQGCRILKEELENKLGGSIRFLCSGREEFNVAFRKVIEMIEPRHMLPVWYPKCEPW